MQSWGPEPQAQKQNGVAMKPTPQHDCNVSA